MELPRGGRVLADHGARRDLAQALAEGIAVHIADVHRRLGEADLVVQVDEPSLPLVLGGRVPTASGLGRYRSVEVSEAGETLGELVERITAVGARAVAHSCAVRTPVGLLANAGFTAFAFDLSAVGTAEYDDYAAAFDAGLDLWPGVVPGTDPAPATDTAPATGTAPGTDPAPGTDTALVARVRRFFGALGYDPEQVAPRLVVTPVCGLAAASPSWTRRALTLARTTARGLIGAAG